MLNLDGTDWEELEEKNLENKRQSLKIENTKVLRFQKLIICSTLNN